MAAVKTNIFAALTIILMISYTAASLRDFPMDPSMGFGLAARLQGTEGDTNDCWSALAELRQCSNEVIAFFLNGQTDIDTPCCNAIEFITRKCWPSMLGVLGFTAQEGSLLAGYCNKASAPASAPLTVTDDKTHY